MRISKARARLTTSRPMLPSPTMPSVLPRSSLPMNFFFSHLPARVDALACGMWRAMASIRASVCSATEMALPPGVFITSTPACGGGVEIDVVHADTGAPDDAQLGRLLQDGLVHLHGAAHQQRVGLGQVLGVFLRIGNDYVPAGLRLKQLDPGRREGLGDQDVHFFTAACAYTSWTAATPVPYCTGWPLALRMISRQAIMANRSAKSK